MNIQNIHKTWFALLLVLVSVFSNQLIAEELPLIGDNVRPSKAFANDADVPSTPKESFGLIFDHYSSPYVGASALITGVRAYQWVDDKLIPTEGDKSTPVMLGRLGKLVIIEGVLAATAATVQHEVFGHGFRFRELGVHVSKYRISPWSGSTSYDPVAYQQLSLHEQAAADSAGIEAETILATQLRSRWLDSNVVDSREANLYFEATIAQTLYAMNAGPKDNTFADSGHDMNNYINTVNTWHQQTVLTAHRVRRRACLDLLDPFLFYSAFTMGDYVVEGRQQWEYPTLNIGDYRYLPGIRMAYAPYGTEYQLNNFIKSPNHLTQVALRYGSNGLFKSYALTLDAPDLFQSDLLKLGTKIDIWKQPRLFTVNTSFSQNRIGAALSMVARYRIFEAVNFSSIDLVGQAGYKTTGYIPGEILKRGAIVRVGFAALI